jgi:hypothetical protein
MRWMVGVVLAAALAGAAPITAWAQTAAPEQPLDYGLFALELLQLGRGAKVQGSVGVNDGEARIGRGSSIAGVIAADVVRLGRRVETEGLTCTLVVGGKGVCVPLTGPLVPQSTLAIVQAGPGAGDIVVPQHARRVALSARSYRRVRIGRGSSLTLAGGEYDFQSLALATRATLACAAPCVIRVARKVVLGRRAAIESPDAADPTLLRIDVQGKHARTALRVGSRARIAGTLYGPNADARFGRRVRTTGPVVVRSLRAGSRIRVERP